MENRKNQFFDTLETILKIATPIGAIVAFMIGIYHYRDSQADEFRKTYWEQRFKVYTEVSHLTAALANADSILAFDSLRQQFMIIHSGKSMLVNDQHVADAMRSFETSLQAAVFPDSLKTLQTKAHRISEACRQSLKETWEPVPIAAIKAIED